LAYEWGVRERAESLADVYFLKKIDFKSGDVFYDCGANVGDLKLWFLFNNIDVTYVGFEPSPIEFDCLKDNVYPSKVHNVGLWNEEGELKFYVSSQLADSSLIKPKEYDEVITSKVVRLETFIEGKIKCLKLEAEGAEPEILEGIGDEKFDCIEYISADLGFERGIDEASTLVPVTNYLLQKGFELIDVSHGRVCALYRNRAFEYNRNAINY
jgi:FkbM family methyltransferase